VTLQGGVCPCRARRFKARPPASFEPGSPFGPSLRAYVIYLRAVQGAPMSRLTDLSKDLIGLDISEGALVNIPSAAREPVAAQTSLIKARLPSGTAWQANWPLWMFHDADSAVFTACPRHSRPVAQGFLGAWRPEYYLSERLGIQAGWATGEHQFGLAHHIRDVQLSSPKATLCRRRA
jgi:transposase